MAAKQRGKRERRKVDIPNIIPNSVFTRCPICARRYILPTGYVDKLDITSPLKMLTALLGEREEEAWK